MKMYLISDNVDTLVGMRLAGIRGCVAHTSEEVTEAVKSALSDKELGILVLTEKAAATVKDYIRSLKLTLHTPLIVEIPDRHGSGRLSDSITSYVKDAVGLKI